jgi:integral membrane protein
MKAAHTLRWAARVEGVSLLLLFAVAMPLKYWAGLPAAVTLAGGVHGLSFAWLCVALFRAHLELGLTARGMLRLLVAAVLPFGFLWGEGELRQQLGKRREADR